MSTDTLVIIVIFVCVGFVLVPPVSYLFGKYLVHGMSRARAEETNEKKEGRNEEA